MLAERLLVALNEADNTQTIKPKPTEPLILKAISLVCAKLGPSASKPMEFKPRDLNNTPKKATYMLDKCYQYFTKATAKAFEDIGGVPLNPQCEFNPMKHTFTLCSSLKFEEGNKQLDIDIVYDLDKEFQVTGYHAEVWLNDEGPTIYKEKEIKNDRFLGKVRDNLKGE